MTRNESGQFGRLRKRAAIFAALFFCATAVAAQDVVLRSEGGGLNISGPLIGFDGENIQIGSPNGPLTLRYDRVICEGVDCPDLATYVPKLRLSGARRMADVLMPALVESFARSQQLQVTLDQIDDSHFVQTLQRAGALQPAGRFSFRTTNTDEGFADLIANETDIVMSVREVRRSEVRLGAEVGLGQLDDPRQSRIVGLDALVPVVAAAASVSAISIADLAAAYSGEITDWSKITGSSDPMTVHLGPVTNGQAQRFIDEVVRGGDR
ncbi:MAG: substrate-binding domain-containing protein, partial [Octadecabacter sp.]|nr:substrate-binding domain-containing protein [Octadecabacter sp.]